MLWLRAGEQTQLRVGNQAGSPRRRQGLGLVGTQGGTLLSTSDRDRAF